LRFVETLELKIDLKGLPMAFTGATTPNVGTDTTNTLSRDVHVGVLEAFKRQPSTIDFLYKKTITGGTGATFTIEGKTDAVDTDVASYTAGTQINVSNSTQDEISITLDRPQYIAHRVDGWDAAVANYDVMAMNYRQIGSKLDNVVDRKAIAAVEAATTATGLVSNGDGTVVVNTAIASATTAEAIGDALCESIFAAVAAIRAKDDMSDLYVNLDPINYSYVIQSKKALYMEYSSNNGDYAAGKVYQVGGAMLVQTNNMPATAALEALVFGYQAAGVAVLWDIRTKIVDDVDFLDAKRIQAYFSNGMAPLRCQSAASIKSA